MPLRMPGTHQERLEKQQRDEALYLVAWLDGVPVGHLLLKWGGSLVSASTTTSRPTLSDISVHPDYQSRGIGSRLMEVAEHLAAQLGYCQVRLSVAIENVRARALYERRGYRDSGGGTHISRWPYLDGHGQEHWREETCVRLVKSLIE